MTPDIHILPNLNHTESKLSTWVKEITNDRHCLHWFIPHYFIVALLAVWADVNVREAQWEHMQGSKQSNAEYCYIHSHSLSNMNPMLNSVYTHNDLHSTIPQQLKEYRSSALCTMVPHIILEWQLIWFWMTNIQKR